MSRTRPNWLQQHADVPLFAAVGLLGLWGLLGWWTHNPEWVQPRPYHHPLSPNTALSFLLLGCAATAAAFRKAALARGLCIVVLVLGLLGMIEAVSDSPWGFYRLLLDPRELIDGARVGRMSLALGAILASSGFLLAWSFGVEKSRRQQTLLLALVGSAAAAYGLAALLGGRVGLERVAAWVEYARVGPLSAAGLVVLGVALGVYAARAGHGDYTRMPRWLWLPVFVGGCTLTALFYVSLREREASYVNSTTQLTLNSLAAAFSAETLAQGSNMTLLATHWVDGADAQEAWNRDAAAVTRAFPAFRSISQLDAGMRTRWVWPQRGNEDAIALDHSRHETRAQALRQAAQSRQFAIASPILTPGKEPSFVIYVALDHGARPAAYLAAEISYLEMLRLVALRLHLADRYQLEAAVDEVGSGTRLIPVLGFAPGDDMSPNRFRQTAAFNLAGEQHLEFALTPYPSTIAPSRHLLPELALICGLGVSGLLGMVVNLAQAAQRRRRRAEETTERLREENEERRRVEAQLKTSDERLNLALASTLLGVFEWDVPTGETHYSPSVWKALGYDAAAMPTTFQVLLDLMHPDDRAEFEAAVDAHFRGGTPFIEGEYRFGDAQQHWTWMSTRAKCVAHDEAGKPQRVIGTCQNITARKESEEALRESRAATRLLSHVARRTDNIVIITTASGNIEWVNDSFTRITGYQLADVNGALFLDLLHSPDSDPRSLERVTAALVAADAVTTEVTATSRVDDQRYHLRLELQPVKNDAGGLEHFIAIAADVTARVETERELRRAKAEADAASRAKSEFLASMSHEIRTPMNGVIGMTSLLLQTNLDAEQKDFVETIRTSGDALLTIINEILDFSKIESGRMEIEQHPFEIAQCVEEALDMFALPAAAKSIELAYRIEPGVPAWILGDITRLRQVLVNLINNAVKFTPQGLITVTVKLHTIEQQDGSRAPYRDEQSVMIDFLVTDTGIGIPEDRQHLLFKPFTQVDSSTTRKYGGTGLGLAICDRLCQLMGGDIDVTSKVGQGSTFRFSILAPPTHPPVEIEIPHLPPWMTGASVLVVDDLKMNRDLLTDSLAFHGVHVLAASMLHDAVELVLKNRIAAAIIDVELVGESGLPLAEQLRRDHPRLPIVLLTNPVENARRTDSQDPCLLRLAKPVKPGVLVECIARQFKQHTDDATAKETPAGGTVTRVLADDIPLKILLVEDNLVNQKVALRFLERFGYRADAAANGVEGVHAVERQKYDLVFMDVQMPEMDGFAATAEIRTRIPRSRQPRIVALTANAIQGDRERCLAAGMDDYIAKPIKAETLHAAILKHFGPDTGPSDTPLIPGPRSGL